MRYAYILKPTRHPLPRNAFCVVISITLCSISSGCGIGTRSVELLDTTAALSTFAVSGAGLASASQVELSEVFVQMEVVHPTRVGQFVAASAGTRGGAILQSSAEQIVIRLPAAECRAFLNQIWTQGRVLAYSVTPAESPAQTDVVNVAADNAEHTRQRLLQLVGSATDIATIQKLERELERVSAKLNLAPAQMVASPGPQRFATVTIQMNPLVRTGPLARLLGTVAHGLRWLLGAP